MKTLSFHDMAQAVAAAYTGRDKAFHSRVTFWSDYFGQRDVATIAADDIEDGLDVLAKRHG